MNVFSVEDTFLKRVALTLQSRSIDALTVCNGVVGVITWADLG